MKNKPNRCILLTLVILLLFGGLQLYSQESGGISSRASQYYLGSEDELLIPVNVWGFVQKPGQYMVPSNTDLVSLLSYAGGPAEDANISNIRIIRNDPRRGNDVWKVNVKRFIETGDERLIPSLKPGDTILVKGTSFYWISRFFEFVSRLTVIAQIFYFVAIAQKAF